MKNLTKLSELFLNVITDFAEQDTAARTFGTGVKLYHSEIHMLQEIKANPELHISALARLLEITRGAAAQTIDRLVKKEMLTKQRSSENQTQVLMELTDQGEIACQNHEQLHQQHQARIVSLLENSSAAEQQFLAEFLHRFKKSFK
ncbi:MarR family winged helix-turn-helix transcriptional regulator [Halanaerobium salsuginis]|jgi:DNA-binding MarR family transcriptional regulator|uniref:Transcriptional regulator, MarR family n=1 Tax=Halanaerobium salsuginis TaxID=29563 RepID=A0A1I4FRM2_9FIRM|nr:MarR family transcriptional regulator [Halanaerobium salsuginis]SFL19920.1 transcriptional regulator, MarR family [Halanaerobium salsuginis]